MVLGRENFRNLGWKNKTDEPHFEWGSDPEEGEGFLGPKATEKLVMQQDNEEDAEADEEEETDSEGKAIKLADQGMHLASAKDSL
jgi:hypothetical protein